MSEAVSAEISTAPLSPVLDRAAARAIVTDSIRRYIAERHALVPTFVDRNFGWRGALALNRRALGLDLARAPANVAMGFATLGKGAVTAGLRVARRRRAA